MAAGSTQSNIAATGLMVTSEFMTCMQFGRTVISDELGRSLWLHTSKLYFKCFCARAARHEYLWKCGGKVPHLLNPGIRCRWVSAACPNDLILWERNPGIQRTGDCEVLRARENVEEKNPWAEQRKTTKHLSENGRRQCVKQSIHLRNTQQRIWPLNRWVRGSLLFYNVLLLACVFLTQNAGG